MIGWQWHQLDHTQIIVISLRTDNHDLITQFLGHRLGDDLVDWNSGVSVRPYVRPYVRTSVRTQKVFPISI